MQDIDVVIILTDYSAMRQIGNSLIKIYRKQTLLIYFIDLSIMTATVIFP